MGSVRLPVVCEDTDHGHVSRAIACTRVVCEDTDHGYD